MNLDDEFDNISQSLSVWSCIMSQSSSLLTFRGHENSQPLSDRSGLKDTKENILCYVRGLLVICLTLFREMYGILLHYDTVEELFRCCEFYSCFNRNGDLQSVYGKFKQNLIDLNNEQTQFDNQLNSWTECCKEVQNLHSEMAAKLTQREHELDEISSFLKSEADCYRSKQTRNNKKYDSFIFYAFLFCFIPLVNIIAAPFFYILARKAKAEARQAHVQTNIHEDRYSTVNGILEGLKLFNEGIEKFSLCFEAFANILKKLQEGNYDLLSYQDWNKCKGVLLESRRRESSKFLSRCFDRFEESITDVKEQFNLQCTPHEGSVAIQWIADKKREVFENCATQITEQIRQVFGYHTATEINLMLKDTFLGHSNESYV